MKFDQIPKPVANPTEPLNREFWELCKSGFLHFQRCDDCGRWRHLPRHQCAGCGSPHWHWAVSSGRGKLFSWTISHMVLHPGFAGEAPYAAIVVELEEGVRMVSGLRDLPVDQMRLDMPLEVCFEQVTENFTVPLFRPASAGQ
ncbi:MAG: OB-fold domain-containing protein [Pseudomonadales bacterium]|jgi:uncharacterized OB-fold protein|nr:OB-fold domain-containing protein [Pseudomonadales bacterium]MCC6529964.1 OB-fold domain-containing protein [Pseudomonadales bacterium]MCP5333903.1 OB-fold domain-containing protein [Pseudomonadales bacterium]HMU89576.1 OB-fold domain-containing protein [Pseudomonadales bacterium]HMW15164.1 OB-fold domain-containing protein [Pseudomonadales bacterium]